MQPWYTNDVPTSALLLFTLLLSLTACSSAPDGRSLRESFATQLAANRFITNVDHSGGDEIRFSGPGAEGEDVARWRVHIDEAVIDENHDPEHPYRGRIISSWYANDRRIVPSGRDSALPLPLTSNGLA